MKISRPLTNPLSIDFDNYPEDEQEVQSDNEIEENLNLPGQIEMDLYDRDLKLRQLYGAAKMGIRKRMSYLEVAAIWKTPALPFAISTLVANILIIFIGGIFFNLSSTIPFFYNALERRWEAVDSSVAIIIAGSSYAILGFSIIYLLLNVFRHDKRLAMIVSWIVGVINILILIYIGQIILLQGVLPI